MADIYDVQTVMAQLAQQAVYPNGLTHPSVSNCAVRIFPGWPIPNTLDADLTARNAQISIYPSNNARATTRYQTKWYTIDTNSPTLQMTVVTNQIHITGTVTSNQQACMAFVNRVSYSYLVLITDTPSTIATNLAALIPNATASGITITVGGNPFSINAIVIPTGTSLRELAREMRMMLVTIWAPTPLIRSQLGNAISVLFGATNRPVLPDGTYGQLSYSGSREEDLLEKVKCYRRDIHFIFEYGITQSETDYVVGTNITNIQDQFGDLITQPAGFLLLDENPFLLF